MTGLVLVAGDFTPFGGMDRANLELARHAAGRHPVHLVTHRAVAALADHPNVTVHRVPRPLGRHLLGQPLLAAAGRQVAGRLSRQGFRVLVNGGNCRWGDVNWVHYVHAAFPARPTGSLVRRTKARAADWWARRTERDSLRLAKVVICNSRRTARDVVEFVGVPVERTRVVYLGTDPAEFALVTPADRAAARRELGWDDRPWAAFVGALGDARKGFDVLYAAWTALCRDPTWDANLAVVGRGADLPRWRDRAAADGLAERVRFLGFRTDVPRILAAADGLAHPARYDAYGLAAHEALCRGIPVIVSAAAGVSERYPPALAEMILRDSDSAGELADRLRYWRTNSDTVRDTIRPFADQLRARTWTDMAADILALVRT